MPNKTRLGFTLIELLVVIAIIAILAAILFPVFARTKEAAKSARALLQMRQLGMATLMYASDFDDHFIPASLRTGNPADTPEIWTALMQPYVKNTDIFIAPGSDGTYATDWSQRFNQSIGYNESTGFDPNGCVAGAVVPPCEGFTTVASFSETDDSSRVGLFALTANGIGGNYRGYVFNPYNGPDHPTDAELGLPLVSDRDLVAENPSLLPSELKPIYCRYFSTGRDQGRAPIVFGDGHAKSFSARAINSFNSGIVFRFR